MIQEKSVLIENLTDVIKSEQLQKRNNKLVSDIKLHLSDKHGIFPGDVQGWINNPEELTEVDVRVLFLLTQQLFLKTENIKIAPTSFFTSVEEKEAKIYDAAALRQSFDLPITFENATLVGNSAYAVPISIQMMDMMLSNQLLHYDPELQREMTVVTERNGGIRYIPTVIKKNVDEIAEHLLSNSLVPTTLVWNAALGSSDSGDELIFDPKRLTLTISKGTKLAIVDGMHRHQGAQKALRMNPDLEFNFILLVTNYSKSQAQRYQSQLAEQTPISKNRKTQLKAARYSDGIVTRLMQESDLEDRISQGHQIKTSAKQLVSYNVLADSIDSYMEIISKRDANRVGDFLIEFFNELVGAFPEAFISEVNEYRNKSLINQNNMFIGYIVLANRMLKENIDIRNLEKIISGIDFDKNNDMWSKLGIIDEKGNLADTGKVRKAIVEFFDHVKIN
ncbi:hypothetical protein EVU96_08910 [Bacillus infantis]|uniref:DNA sulfur modification protein DndB n=1 Tax=Bacillus infantis TaxID=324767 RepID=UPI00101BA846|nr:DNA sulfur modification protein DndB [Bacillus infantis]RYI30524.1 hypothetical protein EVU96_08910 [Bacillus infantis]